MNCDHQKGNAMEVRWSTLILKISVWFCAEVTLTALGLDDLADYGEFMSRDRPQLMAAPVQVALVV